MTDRPEVLVVGAGPSGLTAACALAQLGVDVRVVDRAEGPATTSRANILHARGVEVLERAGALGELRERALAPVGMVMHAQGRPLATMRFSPDGRESTRALFISQAQIEAALRRRLADLGVKVEWGTKIIGLRRNEADVETNLEDGSSVRADYVIGCDGSRSVIRSDAEIEFSGHDVVEQFLLADVMAEWDRERTTSAGFFHRDGILLAIPMHSAEGDGGRLWRLMADVPGADPAERLTPEQIVERLTEALTVRAGSPDVRIDRAVWTSVFRIQRRLAETYRRGRVLIAGDAAHIHSPIGGQGMNTGIGDAENLAWKLALVIKKGADPSLLDTYSAERRPLAREVLRNTTANTKIIVADGPVLRRLRDHLFVRLLGSSPLQRQATRTASQLGVTYRRGPLGSRLSGPGLRPGDRVPDRTLSRQDGDETTLNRELGRAWILLLPESSTESIPASLDVQLRDRLGTVTVLRRQTRVGRDAGLAFLVRPDGHLLWRGRLNPEQILRSVDRLMVR